jgi:cytochrome b
MKSSLPPAAEPAPGSPAQPPVRQVLVWDIAVRSFHWLLVALLALSWYTGETGGLDEMTWHMWSGSAVLALVLFRIVWGLVGSTSARFSHFLYAPGEVVRYAIGLARGAPPHYPGHTPLGGWMIVLMLICLLLQAATGLFANDDIVTEGPLAASVSKETSDWLTALHEWNFEVLLVLAGVHVAAVLFYVIVLRQNLVRAMFTGRKRLRDDQSPSALRFTHPAVALLIAVGAAIGVWLLVR